MTANNLTKRQIECLKDCHGNAWHSMNHPMTINLRYNTVNSLVKYGYLEIRSKIMYKITDLGREVRKEIYQKESSQNMRQYV